MTYNWQQSDWPHFQYQTDGLTDSLFAFAESAGRISAFFENLPEALQMDALINTMVAEAVKTSEIEGEMISREDVISSIKNNLGLHPEHQPVKDKRAQGIAELMLDVRSSFADPMDEAMLFRWHSMLMKGNTKINKGQWRSHHEPMQVISGGMGRETIHFEAPPSSQVPTEMQGFIAWFNSYQLTIKNPVIRSAIAHLYFESVHPFEDGNGRIGRAISEKALAQGLERPVLLSLSRTIENNKRAYYEALKQAQRSNEITPWLAYFTEMSRSAQLQAEEEVRFTIRKAQFFDRLKGQLNDRQVRVIQRMMAEGPGGFQGGMSAKKYMAIAKTSKATATRDLQDLSEKGVFISIGGGRSTHYQLEI